MQDIQYVGEHLLPGQIGQAAIVASFVASLFAGISYFFATQRRDKEEYETWRGMGRWGFIVHGISVFTIIGTIFYLMVNQYYEYQYVQAHVSEDLPFKYIFSAFWEGQEGSFLLWMFWHIVLGLVLMATGKQWEAPTLSVLSLIQLFIGSMLLGIYVGFGDEPSRFGSNPLMLLREVMDAPIFAKADYAAQLTGSGLNPLLQNYWMTIHPPTLFLGFASTSIPFCFAIAALWTREHKAWLKPALRWALFSGAILGTGILMGGAWAYEALSFGGYWAWDPVENMSLVPWLILIAGIHTNLIANSTGHSVRSTYIFYLLTFIFIVYSTFLTRSGVLGDTSVHAFTEMGLEVQLVGFLVFFLLFSAVVFGLRVKEIPSPKKEEATSSKEFWMFIGTLVLLFSALIITASTSLPVYNKIMQFFNPAFEGRVITDPEPHFNKYQLWIAVFIGALSGIAQYLRFREVNFKKYASKFGLHTGIALALTAVITYLCTLWIEAKAWQFLLLLFFGIFTIVTNLDYLATFVRGNLKMAGSAFSHIGFGIMIVGILASGLNKRIISNNPFVMDGLIEGASREELARNILLFKNSPLIMPPYEVTYIEDTVDVHTRTFTVNYKRRDEAGNVAEEFNLYPNVLYDKTFTKIAASNPSTKRYWNRDIFTHIASLPQVEIDMEYRRQREDSLNYRVLQAPIGQPVTLIDTVELNNLDTSVLKTYRATVVRINRTPAHPDYKPEEGDIAIGAEIKVERSDEEGVFTVNPVLVLRGQLLYSYPEQINELNAKVRINEGIFDAVFSPETELDYKPYTFKQGDKIEYQGYQIQFAGFNRKPEHPNYTPREDDIAVSAMISVQAPDGEAYLAQPVYLIRDNRPFNIKDEIPGPGLHFRFTGIDPTTETVELQIAQSNKAAERIPIELATNSLRSDYIVLEAIEFPGINLFWLGSMLMMIGLAVSMGRRIGNRVNV
ncbi:MAG: cytochrome c biogenesis protein CcsA [Lewinellaceae bacterium]|nr:cytochrome c biogenesis protein CcsA [Lewinellaceae bacterium]